MPKLVTLKEAKTIPKLNLTEPIPKLKLGEPFADYTSFEDCVAKNPDKDNPEAYCATIKRQVEGEMYFRKRVAETLNAVIDEVAKSIEFEMPIPDESWKPQNKTFAEAIFNLAKEIRALPQDDTSWKEEIKTVQEQTKTFKEAHDAELKTLKETYDAKLKEITDKTEQQKKDFETILTQADKNIVETRKTLEDRIKELEKENKELESKKVKETTDLTQKLEEHDTAIENLQSHIPSSFKGRNKDLKTQNPVISDPLKKGD